VNWFKSNYFIQSANILLLAGYCIRDILWLRLLVAASWKPENTRGYDCSWGNLDYGALPVSPTTKARYCWSGY
jgi:hypothetical protein